MKNTIEFYYNLFPVNIHKINDTFHFIYNHNEYYFCIYDRSPSEISELCELNKEMLDSGVLVHEIIYNTSKNPITTYNNSMYILLKINVNLNNTYTLKDIEYINNYIPIKNYKLLNRYMWYNLWTQKVDFLEEITSDNYTDYHKYKPQLIYYTGLCENAIAYTLRNTKPQVLAACHREITEYTTIFDIYNPINIVIDSKERDIAEYFKVQILINSNYSAELNYCLNNLIKNAESARLFIARLIYPSYFINLLNMQFDTRVEEKIAVVAKKMPLYEELIEDLLNTLNIKYNLLKIMWFAKH